MTRKKAPRPPSKPKAKKAAEAVQAAQAPELLDVEQAAGLLKVSKTTFYRWLAAGTLPGFKVGGQWRFRPGQLQRFMEERGATITEAPVEIDAEIEAMLKLAGPELAKEDRKAWDGRDTDQPEAEAKVTRLVHLVIKTAIARRASDIHLEPTRDAFILRYRVDGVLHVMREMPKSLQGPLISRLKAMADLNVPEHRLAQDGRIHLQYAGKAYDLRIALVPAVYGESLVVRILSHSSELPSVERQGFTTDDRERVAACVRQPNGLIIFTGPAGSGRTTTAYTWLQTILSPEQKTLTIEDPVEITLPWATQVQVNRKVGLTYDAALRAFMRQDPDIVFAGGIHDLATAEMLFQVALTGHLVMSTLYANTAPGAVSRLMDTGCEPFMISEALNCVVAQRLARRVCTECAGPHAVPEETLVELRARAAAGGYVLPEKGIQFMRGKGCNRCKQWGYYGRTALHEVMVVDRVLRDMIAARRPEEEIRRAAIASGMKTLFADGFRKAAEGVTTVEEVLRVTFST